MASDFFNFLHQGIAYNDAQIERLNWRHAHILEPFNRDLKGARVLDLGAYDGRWSYALAAAGAREVLGVEGRPEMVKQFDDYPRSAFKDNVRLVVNDIFLEVDALIAQKRQFDVIAVYGIFYHITDHYGLLDRLRKLSPKLIVIDGDFMHNANNMIQLTKERTSNPLNALGKSPKQEVTIVGIPSVFAMERMAEVLDYDCSWIDWDDVPETERRPVNDYFRNKNGRKRATCALRPR